MNTKFNPLHPNLKAYYDRMAKSYTSDSERLFFETLKYRQQYVFTFANDLLLSEHDNEDGLFIVRHYWDEFEVGNAHTEAEPFYAMYLEEALEANLLEKGLLDKDITLLEWLRGRDYACIRYDGNFDEM